MPLGSPGLAIRISRRAAAEIMAPSASIGSPFVPVAILDSSAWKPLLACAILQQIKRRTWFRVYRVASCTEKFGLSQRQLVTQRQIRNQFISLFQLILRSSVCRRSSL